MLALRRVAAGGRTVSRANFRQTRALCEKAKVKDAPSAPPPPPAGENSSSPVPLVALAALAGAAYYFQDDIKTQLGMGDKTAEVDDTKMAPSTLRHEVEALGAKVEAQEALEKVRQASIAAAQKAAAAPAKPAAPAPAAPKAEEAREEAPASQSRSKPAISQKPGTVDLNAVRAAIVDILDKDGYDDGSLGPVFVRLAWHSAGTYDKNTGFGGTEGACMRFSDNESKWGANNGLDLARAFLEPIKQQFPDMTYSDLWSFAGTVALEEMGGPQFSWRPGRKDFAESMDSLPNGLLPDADGRGKNPAEHLRDIFYRMGFNDREIVCLSGAHSLGRCHTDRSGFDGPWTRSPTTISNEYYRLLLEETWSKKTSHQGRPWAGPLQFENSETGSDLMMLETDLALVRDEKFKPIVEMYAKDESLFMKDFAQAWIKLQELGVRRFHGTRRYWLFGPRE